MSLCSRAPDRSNISKCEHVYSHGNLESTGNVRRFLHVYASNLSTVHLLHAFHHQLGKSLHNPFASSSLCLENTVQHRLDTDAHLLRPSSLLDLLQCPSNVCVVLVHASLVHHCPEFPQVRNRGDGDLLGKIHVDLEHLQDGSLGCRDEYEEAMALERIMLVKVNRN